MSHSLRRTYRFLLLLVPPLVALAIGADTLASQVSPLAGAGGPPVRRGGAGVVGTDSAAVAATIARFRAALARGDSAAVLGMLAPDAVVLESGEVESRAEYRAHHLPTDVEFERAIHSTRGPLRVTVRGDAAWATTTSTARGTFRERAVNSSGAELVVLTREPGGAWTIRAIHWSSRARRP